MTIADLERSLRRAPHDTPAWLVYGDWLLERGDVRGELVRLEHVRSTTNDPDVAKDAKQEIDRIVAAHRAAWIAELGLGDATGIDVELRNGFAVGIKAPWDERTPALLVELARRPAARFVGTLRLRMKAERPAIPELEALVRVPVLTLTTLDLAYCPLHPAGARVLAAWPRLADLDTLDLRYTNLGDEGIEAIAASRHLRRLKTLFVHACGIGAAGMRALAESEALASLEAIDLRYDPIGRAGAEALAAASFAGSLKMLRVLKDDVGANGARALARSTRLALPIRRYWKARA